MKVAPPWVAALTVVATFLVSRLVKPLMILRTGPRLRAVCNLGLRVIFRSFGLEFFQESILHEFGIWIDEPIGKFNNSPERSLLPY